VTTDPTEESLWRPLRDLLDLMDDDIARLYAERGVKGVRPRFSKALIKLAHLGPLSIKQLAQAVEVTHSAMSQTVTALRHEGLVRVRPGEDARTRTVELTDDGREVVPFLEAEWRATESAVAELEAEVPYPLTAVVRDLRGALARRSFHDRILGHLSSGGVR
jgi:DNA-binding MarR family transcriptional regulator